MKLSYVTSPVTYDEAMKPALQAMAAHKETEDELDTDMVAIQDILGEINPEQDPEAYAKAKKHYDRLNAAAERLSLTGVSNGGYRPFQNIRREAKEVLQIPKGIARRRSATELVDKERSADSTREYEFLPGEKGIYEYINNPELRPRSYSGATIQDAFVKHMNTLSDASVHEFLKHYPGDPTKTTTPWRNILGQFVQQGAMKGLTKEDIAGAFSMLEGMSFEEAMKDAPEFIKTGIMSALLQTGIQDWHFDSEDAESRAYQKALSYILPGLNHSLGAINWYHQGLREPKEASGGGGGSATNLRDIILKSPSMHVGTMKAGDESAESRNGIINKLIEIMDNSDGEYAFKEKDLGKLQSQLYDIFNDSWIGNATNDDLNDIFTAIGIKPVRMNHQKAEEQLKKAEADLEKLQKEGDKDAIAKQQQRVERWRNYLTGLDANPANDLIDLRSTILQKDFPEALQNVVNNKNFDIFATYKYYYDLFGEDANNAMNKLLLAYEGAPDVFEYSPALDNKPFTDVMTPRTDSEWHKLSVQDKKKALKDMVGDNNAVQLTLTPEYRTDNGIQRDVYIYGEIKGRNSYVKIPRSQYKDTYSKLDAETKKAQEARQTVDILQLKLMGLTEGTEEYEQTNTAMLEAMIAEEVAHRNEQSIVQQFLASLKGNKATGAGHDQEDRIPGSQNKKPNEEQNK